MSGTKRNQNTIKDHHNCSNQPGNALSLKKEFWIIIQHNISQTINYQYLSTIEYRLEESSVTVDGCSIDDKCFCLPLVSKDANMQLRFSIPLVQWTKTKSNNVDRKREQVKEVVLLNWRHSDWSLWVKKQTGAEKKPAISSNLRHPRGKRTHWTVRDRCPLSPLKTPAVRQRGQWAKGALVKGFQESGGVEGGWETEVGVTLRDAARSWDTNGAEGAET